MSKTTLMAIDQGTTGSTVMLIDVADASNPKVIGRKTVDFPQHYPEPGWVEHDLEEIWVSVEMAMAGAMSEANQRFGTKPKDIAAIGITNQRETLCTFDRKTGKPLMKAIVWQDKRSHSICKRLKPHENQFREKTGLVLDPYFTGTKITWVLEEKPEIAAAVRDKKAVFGTIDTYLLFRLTGGKAYCTEPSNASRTLAFNVVKGAFDTELCELLGMPHLDCLPEVKDSASSFGVTDGLSSLPDGIPVTGVLGDQQAALAGQTCFSVGDAKCTYGTGAFMLLNLGETFQLSSKGLLTTVAWTLNGKATYAFEGSAFIAGAAVQFLRDQLGLINAASETEPLSKEVLASPEVYFVPALAGLGAPYWDPKAKGAFFGLSRGTSKEQLVRATLEGIAFSVADLYQSMSTGLGGEERSLSVDGGASANNLLMQFQADILQAKVDRPTIIETTAFGAALFAGLGTGMYATIKDLENLRLSDKCFFPVSGPDTESTRKKQIAGWQRAVAATRMFSAENGS